MSRCRTAVAFLSLVAVAFLTAGGLTLGSPPGGQEGSAYVPGEILIKFTPGARGLEKASARAQVNALKLRTFRSGAEHWRLGPGQGVGRAVERLGRNPNVQYVEPNYILTADVIPNDPRFDELWGMRNTGQTGGTADADIDADMAWGVSTGSHSVLVAVIDTGIDYNHPDLAANIWTNPGEIPGNGIDDDGNGYPDDVHGYDFYNDDGDPFDDHGHGTHCAGTIGGIGDNGIGVAGVNWNVTIMGLKFLSSGGSGSTADAVAAVDYSVMMGVDLTSNSWGGGSYSQALYDAIAGANANEMAFVAAAGNGYADNDASPHYPSSYDLPNVIAVAATDHDDAKAAFSNWGATSVDLGAPGVDILSTLPGNNYGPNSGTSMATPHVAGVAALIRAVSPAVPVGQLKSVLLNATDPVASMAGRTVSGGRLNAFFAIADPDDTPPDPITDLATTDPGSNHMGLTWTATGDDGSVGTATYYEVRYSTSPIDETNFDAAARAGNEPTPAPSGTPESMELGGLEASTTYYFAVKAFDEWGNPSPISNIAMGTTLPPPTGAVAPTSISEALYTGEQAAHIVTLSNAGVGTLDFEIPTPSVGEPLAVPPEPLLLGKDDPDPRTGDPIVTGLGGPDPFGYRWIDSDEPGGPAFSWIEISGTGTPITDLDGDDEISAPIALGFDFPFYGQLFDEIRVNTNGWLSFTDTTATGSTSYSNQPLPNAGAPENLVAPFWDDLHFRAAYRAYFQSFGSSAVIQWTNVDRFSTGSDLTFQVILDSSGNITYQYLSLSGVLDDATVGIQDEAKTTGLQVAFNQAYLHDNLAIRIAAIPQWLMVSPTSGRLTAGQSIPLDVLIDASGLEGGTYPAAINIETNDPANPVLTVDVTLVVTGAPDAAVQPASFDFGDTFLGLPDALMLIVVNNGTDVLHVSDIVSSHPELAASPATFDVAPHASQEVTVTWTPSVLGPFSGSVTVLSNDAGEPAILVPVAGNAIPAPVLVADPTSFEETLFSGNSVVRTLTVTNAGGSDLIVDAAADLGDGSGLVVEGGVGALGAGGPDGFGYKWRDSDEPGGPAFNWVDITATGTQISFPSPDDGMSGAIPLGMTFPFYGNNFPSAKVCTNGYMTFDTSSTSCRYSNYSLPSSSLPVNSIAMFWDDLHLRSTGRVHYLYDGTRFILQFTDVERYSSGSMLTFQVQLYPNGKILLQYLSMSGFLTSATIGIQDSTRTDALQVVYNSAYVHDNLAVQISRTPDWLVVAPGHAVIPPGGSALFDVTFDATGRLGGDLNGNVVLNTNIPAQPQVLIPALLHVIGAPQAAVIPESHDYGTVFAGYPHIVSFQVVNDGTDVLNVSDITTTDPYLFVDEPPSGGDQGIQAAFPLPPGAARLFILRWSPAVPYVMDAEVRINSDDPVNPTLVMPVTGEAIPPPVAVWSPASFTESLLVGDVVHRTLHLENQGGSDLDFRSVVRLLGGGPVQVHPELELKKDEEDPRPGILGSGGPDAFGYTWKDSDDPTGPVFDWVDISAVGTPITFSATGSCDDCNAGPIPIGFAFPFYGNTFGEVRVVTNGWLSFTNSTTTDYSNDPLPSAGGPENLLALFWDDLVLRSGTGSEPLPSRVYYHNDGTRFIVQYEYIYGIADYDTDFHFEVILYPSGRIVYQYLTMANFRLNSATIGIQNETRDDGLTVVYNDVYMHDNLAVEFRSPYDFLTVTPESGTVPLGGAIDLDVTIDATALIGGDYPSVIDLSTNDPAHALISVPVDLHVTGIPDIEADPASLTFPTTFVGFTSSLPVTVRNVGTDVLHIASWSVSDNSRMSAMPPPPPIDLPVGGEIPMTMIFAPTTDGLRLGSLDITSDDPDEGILSITLEGFGLFPPEIAVAPASIDTALPPGGTRTKTLTISNTGGSDLDWTAGTNIISALGSVTPGSFLALGKDEEDPRVGILGSGGPDLFGYSWTDSDEPGGPVFDWVDIRTTGTPVPYLDGDDENKGPIPIGFPFPFYGNTFTELRACTNGWLSFTSTATALTNQPLPNSSSYVPENMLAVFWDDLHFRYAERATYLNDGSRFIIQYTEVDKYYPSGASFTFQVILYPSGKIVFQYETMSGTLNSATIGIQNATKDDGLTVVYNVDYMHDNLAIALEPMPEWLVVSPASGTIPAGGSEELTVALNAAGMEDGLHEAIIDVASNDPYTPLVSVPVSLNVGLVEPTYVDFDPDVLNLSSSGTSVKMVVELPDWLDPHLIRLSSVMLNDAVPAAPSPPPEYTDMDGNGIEEVSFKFDRAAVEAVLTEGESVTVTIQGEVEDVQWWRGSTTIRAIRPQVTSPGAGEYFLAGSVVPIRWTEPAWGAPMTYTIQLSRDAGATWEEIAGGLTGTAFDWVASGEITAGALIRVLAIDDVGLLGYDTSDGLFTIAGPVLLSPYPVDGLTLVADYDAAGLTILWKEPVADLGHGPADRYRVLQAENPQGPYTEAAVVTLPQYTEPGAAMAPGSVLFYRIVAGNAAGDAQ
jgi:subtilisin family serine protease